MYERVIIVNDEYCSGEETGKKFLGVFFRKILASLDKPEVIIFYNSAVKLLTVKSDIVTILGALQISGVDLIACGMCQDESCENKSLLVGRITSMDEIVSVVMKAKTVITL